MRIYDSIRYFFKLVFLNIQRIPMFLFIFLLPRKKSIGPATVGKKILLIRHDKMGDMVVTTPLIRNLFINGYEVYVVSKTSGLQVIKHNPYVKGTFVYSDASLKSFILSLLAIRKENFDIAVTIENNYPKFKRLLFASLVKTEVLIGFSRSRVKSYNLSIHHRNTKEHVTSGIKLICSQLNIPIDDFNYDIFISDETELKVREFFKPFKDINSPVILINPNGGAHHRCLSIEQSKIIIDNIKKITPTATPVLLGNSSSTKDTAKELGAEYMETNSILDVAGMVKHCDMVISVDTSVVHIATGFNKKCIAIYKEDSNIDDQSLKNAYQKSYDIYKINNQLRLLDKPYLLKNPKTYDEFYINSMVWNPNNPNAKQIVFISKSLRSIDNGIFTREITNSLS